MIFTSSVELDERYATRTGQTVVIVRPLTEAEADPEVGPMFRVRFPDGFEGDAFEDELVGL
jgi:hypothetical protein